MGKTGAPSGATAPSASLSARTGWRVLAQTLPNKLYLAPLGTDAQCKQK